MSDERPRIPEDDALFAILHSPLDDEPSRRGRKGLLWLLGGVAVAVAAVVAALLLLRGGGEPEASETSAGAEPAVAGVTSTDAGAAESTTSIVTGTTLPGEPGYPEARILAPGVSGGPGLMVMVGGVERGGSVVGDAKAETWTYAIEGNAWYRAEGIGPRARMGQAAAFDEGSGVVVVFGGATGQGNYCRVVGRCATGETAEVWVYSPETGAWRQQPAADAPPGRFGAVAGYDTQSDRVVLFGGARNLQENAAVEMFQDTWAYDVDTNTWTEMTPETSPPARGYAAMAYDPEADRLLMFGGSGVDEEIDATVWAYDLDANTWTPLEAVTSQPEPMWDATFVYADAVGMVVLIGGEGPQTREIAAGITATEIALTDAVWLFDSATRRWSARNPAFAPIAGQTAIYDPLTQRVVVYADGSTWLYDPAADVWENLTPEG